MARKTEALRRLEKYLACVLILSPDKTQALVKGGEKEVTLPQGTIPVNRFEIGSEPRSLMEQHVALPLAITRAVGVLGVALDVDFLGSTSTSQASGSKICYVYEVSNLPPQAKLPPTPAASEDDIFGLKSRPVHKDYFYLWAPLDFLRSTSYHYNFDPLVFEIARYYFTRKLNQATQPFQQVQVQV